MSTASRPEGPDPFTVEIIKDSLLAANEEMFVAMQRASKSPIIYEVLDYATGITDAGGRLIAQGNGVTLFLGTLTYGVADVLAKFGPEGVRPGDVFAVNDPYAGGGTHLSDVALIMPVFHGQRLIAFCANKAHWTEVGGKDPGSWTTDATEIYQEGLQFPCVRVFAGGRPLPQMVDLIAANVRLPDMTLGDFHAQAASLRVAARRIAELCDKYGLDTVLRTMAAILEQGALRAHQELARLPAGTYRAEAALDGMGGDPVPVQVAVTIGPEGILADFSGSAPQVGRPVNCTRTSLLSAIRLMWLAMTDPGIAPNEGFFSVLQVACPPRTVLTAERPAPTSTYWEGMSFAVDLIWRAMVAAVPERLPAGHFLSVCSSITATHHVDRGDFVLLVEPQAGGWGAGRGQDGEGGLVCSGDGETYVLPVEVTEEAYGLRVERYAFNPAPGGEGEFRGGRGLVREYRILHPRGGHFTGIFGRHEFPAWGMDGGQAGSPNYIQVVRADGTSLAPVGVAARLQLGQGDLLRLVTGAGGGWGPPRRRPREQVAADVRAGLLQAEEAACIYGA